MIELMSADEISKIEEETAIKPLDAGRYRVQVTDTSNETGKESGNAMIKWTFKTIDCDEANHNGRVLFDYTVLPTAYTEDQMDKNGDKSLKFWATKKLTETVMAFGESQFDEDNISEWVGKECNAAIKQEEYNGNINNKIGRLLPLD